MFFLYFIDYHGPGHYRATSRVSIPPTVTDCQGKTIHLVVVWAGFDDPLCVTSTDSTVQAFVSDLVHSATKPIRLNDFWGS